MSQMADDGAIIFEEKQAFRQWWILAIMALIFLGSLWFVISSTYHQLIMGHPYGDKPLPDGWLVLVNIFILLVGVALPAGLFWMRLVVRVYPDRLLIDYFPLARKEIPMDQVESWEAVQYSPIMEYGGWGARYSLAEKRWAFNVSGNQGVKVDLTDGRKWLIGTQKKEELAEAIAKARQS